MRVLLVALFLITSVSRVESFLTATEWKVFMGLVVKTHVNDAILAPRDISFDGAAKHSKFLSSHNVSSLFLKREHLRDYIEHTCMPNYRWTAVVLKETSLRSLDCFNSTKILSSYFWIIFDVSNGTLLSELQGIEIPFDTALLLVREVRAGYFTIKEYYNIQKDTPGVLRLYAEWVDDQLEIKTVSWFDRKSNMQKYHFKTLKFNEALYLTPKDKVNEEIWKELSRILNFTIDEKVIVYSLENGHMDLDTGDDEAFLDTQIYLRRSGKYIYLLGPTSTTKLFMHVKVSGEDTGFARLVKPFSKYTWIQIGLWVLYSSATIFVVEYFKPDYEEKRWPELRLLFFAPLQILCNQSGLDAGPSASSRIALFLIRVTGTVIYYSYSAIFISYLLLYIPKLPFTDLKGFVEDGTYKIEGERNSDVDTYFSVSPDPLEKLVYEKYFSDVAGWSRFDKGVDRMCAGEKLVLIGYDNDIENYQPCNIVKIKKPIKILANGFKIRFRSPFRGIMQIKLLLLRDTGILQKVNKGITSRVLKKYEKDETYEISVEKVFSVLILFESGCLFSAVVLSIEVIYWKLKSKKKEMEKEKKKEETEEKKEKEKK